MIINYTDKIIKIAENCQDFVPFCPPCQQEKDLERNCYSCNNWNGSNCQNYLEQIEK